MFIRITVGPHVNLTILALPGNIINLNIINVSYRSHQNGQETILTFKCRIIFL